LIDERDGLLPLDAVMFRLALCAAGGSGSPGRVGVLSRQSGWDGRG
jgi:hypothetical protein